MVSYRALPSLVHAGHAERRRKASMNITTLPVELLVVIFQIYCTAVRFPHRPSYPEIRLTQICRHWHHIVINMSDLWTTFRVSTHSSPDLIQLYLCRSQNLPLNLTCDFRLKDFLVQQDHFAEVFHIILLASARWSQVSIRFDERYGTEITNKLNGLNVPLLEYFQFTSSSYSVNDVNLLRDAHSLKKLQLSCASLRDFKNVLHGITSLYLTAHYPMTFQEFRDTMLLIPHLTDLSMLRCNIDNWPSLPSSDDIIPLPSLSTLEFADRRYTLFYPLLWISAPGLQTITLHDIVDHDLPQSATIPLLLQNFPAVRKLILQGSASFLEEASFMELNSIFPMLDHVAIVLSQELFVEQFTYAMLETALWPRLRSVTMNPPASENSICNMIAVRAISNIPLSKLVITPSQFVRIDWLNQQVKVEVCDMSY